MEFALPGLHYRFALAEFVPTELVPSYAVVADTAHKMTAIKIKNMIPIAAEMNHF